MRPHRVLVLDVLTKHPPQMPFVDGDDVIEALAPQRPDHPLGDGVGVRRAQRSQNRLDPDPSSACDEVPAIATVAVSDEEPWLLTPGGRLDQLPPDPGRDRVLRDVSVPDAAPAVVDHDAHVSLSELVGGYAFAEVVAAYWRGHDQGDTNLKASAVRWLRGEYATRTDARRDLGVRTIVDDGNVYDQLKLLARFVRLAGYTGLVVALDELVNLREVQKSLDEHALLFLRRIPETSDDP